MTEKNAADPMTDEKGTDARESDTSAAAPKSETDDSASEKAEAAPKKGGKPSRRSSAAEVVDEKGTDTRTGDTDAEEGNPPVTGDGPDDGPALSPAQYDLDDPWGETPAQMR
jgi:hypothetical protein